MSKKRISRTTTISLPPKLYKEVLRMAREKGMTKSELFREALRTYQVHERQWEELLAYGRRKAKDAGIRTEEDIERLIDESRD